MIEEARTVAERALADALPQRWMHVRAVAHHARRLADALPDNDGMVLVEAAWLHDVGYSPEAVQAGSVLPGVVDAVAALSKIPSVAKDS